MTPERYKQVGQLFRAAREMTPEQRTRFIAEACEGDQSLQQDVESLLAYEARTDGIVDRPALEVTAEALAAEQRHSLVSQQIDHYQIVSLLGRGGMGEVYRARDTRLDRQVAIKILPVAYSLDSDRLRRFEQEARAAGKLNHPNVLTVYDVGVHNGAPYIVTELLDGEELRSQLHQGAVPQRRALDYAQQIANGLAAAHAKGIVHRDLKPENVFITTDGRVKILDFGLAKLKTPMSGSAVETAPPLNTVTGVVMGTVGYMPPEQVRGQDTDGRSDIFALGVILYEMLSGRRPFSGTSNIEVMNAILKEDPPDLLETNARVTPSFARIIHRCLEKRPEQRFQSASDLAFAVAELPAAGAPSSGGINAIAVRMAKRYVRRLALALAIALLAGGGLAALRLNKMDYWWSSPLADARFTLVTDFPEAESDAVISRDGKFVAFLSDRDGPFDVWAGQIGTGEFQNLTKGKATDVGNPRVRNLMFTPDGSQISVEVRINGRVFSWAVPTLGGSVHPYMDGVEIAWSPDGKRVAYHTDGPGDPIFVSSPDEKIGKQIYAAARGVHCHYLAWSPDGAFIYFVQGYPPDEMDIWRIRPTGGQAEKLTSYNSRVAYPILLNKRTLLYTALDNDGTGPWLYGMDVERRVPHRISFGVERYTSIAASADGRRLVATVANPEASLWRVPISDRIAEEPAAHRMPLPTMRGLSPRIGPGYMLYLSSKGGTDGIWKVADGRAVELWNGSAGRVLDGAAISPDGAHVAFAAQKSGRNRLYVMNSDGTNVTELGAGLNVKSAPAWPPVGNWITVSADQGQSTGLFKIALDGGAPIQLVREPVANPVWSPDGRFLVYSGVEVGTTLQLKAVTADGQPYSIPELTLSRGANRFSFLPGRTVLVVLKGDVWHKNFWLVDLVSGKQRQLTNFNREYLISDFDISPNGQEITFGRVKENSNIVLIDLPGE
jgi:Tol biopolymer transport system component